MADANSPPPVLHSPFSPLSPTSPLYPDGLIDDKWLRKHQNLVPCIYLCFYQLTNEPTLNNMHDSNMRTDITNIKNALGKSGYKTRLAIIIMGQKELLVQAERVQERLELIRKAAGMDNKYFLYIPPQESENQLIAAMDAILGGLFAQAMDYYRDLARHVKKKRGRGIVPQPTVPPTSGTSRTLSLQAWNMRYDFKSAIFSEFKQDMDAALRLYEVAYDALFGSDVWETIPSWSPRWNEARTLADILAVRILRCLLWLGMWSSCVKRWRIHRDRINEFIDRLGHGTENYGWEAWQARWATIMAQLIHKVDITELTTSATNIYVEPEKPMAAERLSPWDLLHHPGYWHQLAAQYQMARRRRTRRIPEADRQRPIPPAASKILHRAYAYDSYMCPEPYEELPLEGMGVNHSNLILQALSAARHEFRMRGQTRLEAELAIECANELMNVGNYKPALELLLPLWENMTFRAEGWWDISERLSWMLRSAAKKASMANIVVSIDWELMNCSKYNRFL